jgi:hypothetical protein
VRVRAQRARARARARANALTLKQSDRSNRYDPSQDVRACVRVRRTAARADFVDPGSYDLNR